MRFNDTIYAEMIVTCGVNRLIKINRFATAKFLGTYIDEHMDWEPYVSQIYRDYKQSQILHY